MNFKNLIPKSLYKENVDLSALSSMKTGGKADVVFYPTCEQDLLLILKVLKEHNLPIRIFGNMGNVLFPDVGMRNPIIITQKMTCKKNINDCAEIDICSDSDKTIIYTECGVSLTSFAFSCCKNSLSGLEFAFGIPASVGGAIYMNAGAYGGETGNVVKYVKCIDLNTLETQVLPHSECDFSYRHSAFMENNKIIVGGYYVLNYGNKEEILNCANQYMSQRKQKQPLEYPSCGSAFKRPEGYFAGKLIEDCGLKGYSVGGACVSEKHAGFIVNKGSATTNDILELINYIQNKCIDKFGVMLEPEIRIIKDI